MPLLRFELHGLSKPPSGNGGRKRGAEPSTPRSDKRSRSSQVVSMSPGGTLAAPFDPNAEVPVLPSDLMEPDDRATGVGEAAQEEVAADGGDGAEEEPEAAAEANDAGAGEEE